jgi:hypothetical protein
MREALTPLFLLAAGILVLAGLAKLRAPGAAVRAMHALGLPGRPAFIRGFAVAEIALGGACAVAPTSAGALAMASLYLLFAVLTFLLARRQASCGCFGDGQDSPASLTQSLLSGVLALSTGAGALALPHSLGWVLARPVPTAAALAVGILGAVYAAVVAYTQLPQAWGAWSAR